MGGYIWDKKAMVQHLGLGPNSSQTFDRDEGAASRFFDEKNLASLTNEPAGEKIDWRL
jgi:hypothetical protein